ncbi:MAG: metalloregulator ArsR/SmtB family transcription factor [Candidatus Brocadiia bacterium]
MNKASGIQEITKICKALSVDKRVRIIQVLMGRCLCVGAISSQFGISAGAVSQHLRILKEAGLIEAEKRGYYVHYRIRTGTLSKWRSSIGKLIGKPIAPFKNVKMQRCTMSKIK